MKTNASSVVFKIVEKENTDWPIAPSEALTLWDVQVAQPEADCPEVVKITVPVAPTDVIN